MSKNSSSSGAGSIIILILALAVIGAALKFFQENWLLIAVIGGALLIFLIIWYARKAKARKEYLSQPVVYIGNASTKTLHYISCRLVADIRRENCVSFRSYEEAAAKGYSPCGVCKPKVIRN